MERDKQFYTEISKKCNKRIEYLIKKKEESNIEWEREISELCIIRNEFDDEEQQKKWYKDYKVKQFIKMRKKLIKNTKNNN